MSEKVDQCTYHAGLGEHPGTNLVRITCPVCGYFRVAPVCADCYRGITGNIERNDGTWPCPNVKCKNTDGNRTRVRYAEYWALMGAA